MQISPAWVCNSAKWSKVLQAINSYNLKGSGAEGEAARRNGCEFLIAISSILETRVAIGSQRFLLRQSQCAVDLVVLNHVASNPHESTLACGVVLTGKLSILRLWETHICFSFAKNRNWYRPPGLWVINWNSVNTFLSTFGSSQLKMTVPNTQILQYLDGLLTQGKKDDVMNYLKSLPDDERKGNPKRPACCQIHKYCFFCIVFANFINFRITKTFGCLQRTKRSWDVLPRFRRRCIPTKLISLKK